MSKIIVNKKVIIDLDPVINLTQDTDETNETNETKHTKTSFTPNGFAYLQTDYLGNIYLKHNDSYYFVNLDSASDHGIELSLVVNPDTFRKNLAEMGQMVKDVKSGEIRSGTQTLRGRIYESLNEMTEDERDDYLQKNDGSVYDPLFKERDFFWVQYKQDDELLEDEQDDTFFINGFHDESIGNYGIMYSDLLCPSPGSFDTILIDGDLTSKNVVSNVERVDGYCTCRLTVYGSGHLRTNFIDVSKIGILCLDPMTSQLIVEKYSS